MTTLSAPERNTEVGFNVIYGIGAACYGRLQRESISGLSTRELIARVAEHPQAAGPASRTATVLMEVLRSGRPVDVELVHSASANAEGEPIGLDDPVSLREAADVGGSGAESDELTIRISESYQGGQA